MKKSYLMIAAAAALFAACASNDTFKEIEIQDSPISFNPYSENVSKAAITGATDAVRKASLASAGGFKVYGYKTTDSWSHKTDIFNSTTVSSTDGGTTWTYSGLRFWDKTATYNFYAVAPASPKDNATYSINTTDLTSSSTDPNYDENAPLKNKNFGYITITNVKCAKAEYSNDFLLDFDGNKGVAGSTHYSGHNDAVPFDFHHIMAKVTFALKSSLSSGTITVTELKMSGYNVNAGTYTQANATTPTARPTTIETSGWSQTEGTAGEVYLIHSDSTIKSVSVTCSGDAKPLINETNGTNQWCIMVPQTIAANTLKFTLSYTFTGTDNYTESYVDQEATLTGAQTWGTDSYTNYTIDINPAEIKFDVTSICNFDNNGGVDGPVIVQ